MKKFRLGAVMLVVVVLIVVSLFNTSPAASVEVGKQAPAFTLKDPDGKEHSLDKYLASKLTVVMFIATQCPISNDYNERMAALYNDFSSKGVAFVGINSNKQEDAAEVKEHATRHGFKFDVLKDWNNVVADEYGAQVTPEVFVLNQKAVVLYHGRIDDSRNPENIKTRDLREALTALLDGKSISRPVTKAFGCTIKRVK